MNQHTIDNQPEILKNFRSCHMRGCLDIDYSARWYPVLSISPDNLQRAYLPFPHWLMCRYHKNNIGLEDLIDGPVFSGQGAWELIQSAFARNGKNAPQREYANLLWRPA